MTMEGKTMRLAGRAIGFIAAMVAEYRVIWAFNVIGAAFAAYVYLGGPLP